MLIRNRFAAVALSGALVLAACSGDDAQQEAQEEQTAEIQNPHEGMDMDAATGALADPHGSQYTTAEGVTNPHTPGPSTMPGEGGVTEIMFRCPSDQGFLFGLYELSDSARVSIEGKTYELKRIPSASGMKYTDGTWTFFGQGPEALLMKDDEVVMKDCKAAGHP